MNNQLYLTLTDLLRRVPTVIPVWLISRLTKLSMVASTSPKFERIFLISELTSDLISASSFPLSEVKEWRILLNTTAGKEFHVFFFLKKATMLTIFKSNFLHRVSIWQFEVSLQFKGQIFLTVKVSSNLEISKWWDKKLNFHVCILHGLKSV